MGEWILSTTFSHFFIFVVYLFLKKSYFFLFLSAYFSFFPLWGPIYLFLIYLLIIVHIQYRISFGCTTIGAATMEGLDEKEVWRVLAHNCTWRDNGKRAEKNGDMAERSGRTAANYIYRSSRGRAYSLFLLLYFWVCVQIFLFIQII